MSMDRFGRMAPLEKTSNSRLSKEVRDLTHRRDNMVVRVLSAYEDSKKHRPVRVSQWSPIL